MSTQENLDEKWGANPDAAHVDEPLTTSVTGTDPAVEKRIVRKYDLRIMPIVTLIYLLSFIDRSNAGNAKVLGMAKDLNLVGLRFNIGLSCFYVTYIIFEIPANVMCHKLGPKIWLPFLAFGFGMVTMFSAVMKNYAGFIAVRLCLGIFEAGIAPGIAYALACFYTRDEIMGRIGIYLGIASLSGAFGGLLAAALNKIPPWGMIHTWRNIFFFEGLVGVLFSVFAYVMLPASPGTARFLTDEERRVAVVRMERDMKSQQTRAITKLHFKRALLNTNTILCSLYMLVSLGTVSSMSFFSPSILVALGYSGVQAQLLSVPLFAWATVVVVCTAVLADHTGRRGVWLLMLTPFTVIGFVLLITVKSVAVRYFALFLPMTGAFVSACLCTGWAVDNSAGLPVRAVVVAFLATLGNMGSLIASWTYTAADAPRYIKGHSINLVFGCCAVVLVVLIMGNLARQNRRKDSGQGDGALNGLTEDEVANLGHLHPEFRYHI